jgi:hypothetical protein
MQSVSRVYDPDARVQAELISAPSRASVEGKGAMVDANWLDAPSDFVFQRLQPLHDWRPHPGLDLWPAALSSLTRFKLANAELQPSKRGANHRGERSITVKVSAFGI